jgi:SAM-dependent methyltransferase
MGVRLPRHKPRTLLGSLVYRLNQVLPGRLDIMLDLAAVTNRLAWDNAAAAGIDLWGPNEFLHQYIRPTDRVLEVGCGSGRVLSTIRAAERVGIDYDKKAIERGRTQYPELKLIHGEAREFLKTAGRFDVLILSHVLEHLDDPEEFLSSFVGKFQRTYVEVPDFDASPLNQVRILRRRNLIYQDADHVAEFDRTEIESLFQTVGLTILGSEFRWGAMRYWLTSEPTVG